MMNIDRYVSSLLPNFESKRIYSSLDRIKAEYEDTVTPVYLSTTEAFKATMFSVPQNKEFAEQAKKYLDSYKGSIHESIYKVLLKVPGKLDILTGLVKEHYDTHVTSEGMTYAKVNVLQMIEIMDFTAMYARRLLLSLYTIEATPFEEKLKERAFQREVEWLVKGSQAFYTCLNLIDMKDKDFERKFKAAKDMIVTPGQSGDVATVVGSDKLDPLKTGFIPYQWSPIYHLRVIVNDWQFARLEAAKAERDSIELRILQLRQKADDAGKRNPKLEKQIEYNEGRLNKLRKKINDMEEDANDE